MTNNALALNYFRDLREGEVVRLNYNNGAFTWVHDSVEGNSVFGRLLYEDDALSIVGDYLYEHNGEVCRSSGSEPVYSTKCPRILMKINP